MKRNHSIRLIVAAICHPIVLLLMACSQQSSSPTAESRIARLEQTTSDLKPGLGEIMGVIQQHHAKLYYSGIKENWPLAQYQLGEIQEGLDDAAKYYPKFKEVKASIAELIPTMTKGSLEEVSKSIEQKNKKEFIKAFNKLNIACTSCHRAAEHPFIVIQAPSEGMFSNQKFEP